MSAQDTLAVDLTWDLESIFPGGSKSVEYEKFRSDLEKDITKTENALKSLPEKLDDSNHKSWIDFILILQDLENRLQHANSFAGCLVNQNVEDEKAQQIHSEMDVYISRYMKLMIALEALSKKQDDNQWQKLVNSNELKEIEFFLNELRRLASMKMEQPFEELAADLAVNGYHAWNRLYDKQYGDLRVQFEEDGKTKELSIGQVALKMSDPDRNIRKQAHVKLEEAWHSVSNQMSMALNFQAGFRLTLYKRRKWKSALVEPMINARMKEDTLNAMWDAVSKGVPPLKKYIDIKKKLLGIDKFKWYDQFAPVGQVDRKIEFAEAGDFVVELINGFSVNEAEFCRMALDKRWVEAENRPGKGGGGFCTTLSVAKESRIFMTYDNTFNDLATLAHELGHAYHHHVIRDFAPYAQEYPMNLAETASIFNELLVFDAAIDKSNDKDEKIMMLDQKLQNAFTLFCNIYARFLFDKSFYVERAKGMVSKTRLDELMVEAQKKAFGGLLEGDDAYHPLFWVSKLHFFLTDQPFYNFPYTYGFLFATGVYNRAKKEGKAFAPKYEALLKDTGIMTCEEVAQKHLGVDLTKADFWNEAVNLTLNDVDEFVKLTG